MIAPRRSLLALGLAVAAGSVAAPSRAHIDLQVPLARAPGRPGTYLPRGPCGQIDGARRPERVSRFEPGQSIDVVWEVYVQHPSYFRIAFDSDGDDSFSARAALPDDPASDDPTRLPAGDGEQILAYVLDPSGSLDRVEQRVTLPDEECDSCTLQVIQFTYGLPLAAATYHQCADIELRRSTRAAPDAGSTQPVSSSAELSGGCTLLGSRPGAPGAPGRPLLLLAFAVLLRARRRRRAERR